MNTVTQKMMFRQSLIHYAEKKGVTKAAIKYNVNRQERQHADRAYQKYRGKRVFYGGYVRW